MYACVQRTHQNTVLTIIIANIGATNPHIAPFLTSIQQLFYNYIPLYNIDEIKCTHKSSCPY